VESDVAYITLPPGSAPEGRAATIRNLSTGASVDLVVGAGGFDPTPIAASAGDMISVVVRDLNNNIVLQPPLLVVVARRRPVVVRTNPPPGKRDVPLNSRITVVFSEPVETATLTNSSVVLRLGSTVVAGQLVFRDSDHVAVVFIPTNELAPAATYTLSVSQTIRDLDGESLESSVSADFVTDTITGFAQYRVSISGSAGGGVIRQVGDSVEVQLATQVWNDVPGFPSVEGAVARFRGSPVGIIRPDTTTTSGLDGLINVVWRFRGVSNGSGGTAQLTACASNSATRCDLYRPLITFPYGPP
jgi:hypothetical protein